MDERARDIDNRRDGWESGSPGPASGAAGLIRRQVTDCPFIGDKAIFHDRDIYDHLARFFGLTET